MIFESHATKSIAVQAVDEIQ